VTGTSEGAGTGEDFATEALSASTGSLEWARRYNGPGNGDDQAVGLALSPDGGRVYVTGSSDGGSSTGVDVETVAYDAGSGAIDWTRRWSGPAARSDTASGIVATADGKEVVVAGTTVGASTGEDYLIVAYSQSTGSHLWTQRYNGPANGDQTATVIAASPDSSQIFVSGHIVVTVLGTKVDESATIGLDAATGAKQWIHDFPTGAASGIVVSPDSSEVYVDGSHLSGTCTLVAYDTATGSRTWSRSNWLPDCTNGGLAITPDGKEILADGTAGTGSQGLSYETQEWSAANGTKGGFFGWSRPATDDAYAIAVSPDSKTMYVTGQSEAQNGSFDYATVAASLPLPPP
jgi:hypothetical protein